jgi:hypothetical protein
MDPETKEALAVKSLVVELMKEHVYRGKFDSPSLKPDRAGGYNYRDKRLEVACFPSGRDGWLNCAVTVSLVRGRWPLRKLEAVLSTGFGVEVALFRPGKWIDYVSKMAERARNLQLERDKEEQPKVEEEARRNHEARFGPVDDSSIFKEEEESGK